MKTKVRFFQAWLSCAVAFGMGSYVSFAATFSDANWSSLGGVPGTDGQVYAAVVDGSGDTADPDGDGVDNYHEWLAGTNPTNALSSPAQLTIIPSGTNVILTWPTNAVGFILQSTTNLVLPAVWSTNSSAPVVIAGQNAVTNPITGPQQFYRLVQ